MRFVLLMAEPDHYARWPTLGDEERAAVFEAFSAFSAAVAERGTVIAGEGLADPGQAVTLRPGGTVTDGPYAETVEQVGGLWIVDLPDRETAVELARLLPPSFSVEVRPATDG